MVQNNLLCYIIRSSTVYENKLVYKKLFENKEDLNLTLVRGLQPTKIYLCYIKDITPSLVKY